VIAFSQYSCANGQQVGNGVAVPFNYTGVSGGGGAGGNGTGNLILQQGVYQVSFTSLVGAAHSSGSTAGGYAGLALQLSTANGPVVVSTIYSNFIPDGPAPSGLIGANIVGYNGLLGSMAGTATVQVDGPNQTLQFIARPIGYGGAPPDVNSFFVPCELLVAKLQ
jgi:hypothetical protein